MKRFLSFLVIATLVMVLTIPTLAQPGAKMARMQHRTDHQFGLGRMLHDPNFRTKLGITDEQYSKLRTAFLDSSKAAIQNHADLKIKRLELADLMSTEKVDRAQVNQKINEISALQTAIMKNQVETRLTVKETLTPDQLNKLQQWRQAQMRRFMQERTQPRMGRMWCPEGPAGRAPAAPPAPPQPPASPKPGDQGQ